MSPPVTPMSFQEHAALLVAEHERLQQAFSDLYHENGLLRERLRAAGGEWIEAPPISPLPSGRLRAASPALTPPLFITHAAHRGAAGPPPAQPGEAKPAGDEAAGDAAAEDAAAEDDEANGDVAGEFEAAGDEAAADQRSSRRSSKLVGDWDAHPELPAPVLAPGAGGAVAPPAGTQPAKPPAETPPPAPSKEGVPHSDTQEGLVLPVESARDRFMEFGSSTQDLGRRTPGAGTPGVRRESLQENVSFDDQPPQIWPDWAVDVMSLELSPSDRLRFPMLPRAHSMICGEALVDENNWLQRLILRPNSTKRSVWDFLSVFVLGYDIVYIPLEVFAMDPNMITQGMEFGTTCFWTMDMAVSFLTGYHSEGLIEMRPGKIARRYLRTGFCLDAVVIIVDWILAIFTFQIKAVVRVGKTTRAIRLVRMVRAMRLLRSLKMARLMQLMFRYIKSDLLRTLISIFLMLLVLVVFNHYFACGWYLIGYNFEPNWLQPLGVESDDPSDFPFIYASALHWSLTQFTPASMEVYPHSLPERVYTICVLLFALVTFSSFVSSITSGMMYLRKLRTEPAQQEAILRQYFQESKISAELGQRIWVFLYNNHFQHRKRVHRKDLEILKLVPDSLMDLLREELYLPVVTWSPFVKRFNHVYPLVVNEVCHRAITEKCLTTREELFFESKPAEKMSFVTMGTMDYRHRQSSLCCSITAGQWACEAVLWLSWTHCGRLSARTSCEIIQLHAGTFRAIIKQHRLAHGYVSTYAKSFRVYLATHTKVWYTDIWSDVEELKDLLHGCEEEHPWAQENLSQRPSWASEQPVMNHTTSNSAVFSFLAGLFWRWRSSDEGSFGRGGNRR